MLDVQTERYLCMLAVAWFFGSLTLAAILDCFWTKIKSPLRMAVCKGLRRKVNLR